MAIVWVPISIKRKKRKKKGGGGGSGNIFARNLQFQQVQYFAHTPPTLPMIRRFHNMEASKRHISLFEPL